MNWHSQPRERKRERSGESPGKERKGVKERGSGDSRAIDSNEKKGKRRKPRAESNQPTV